MLFRAGRGARKTRTNRSLSPVHSAEMMPGRCAPRPLTRRLPTKELQAEQHEQASVKSLEISLVIFHKNHWDWSS